MRRPVPALLVVAALAGCGFAPPSKRPNVLIVTFDTTRADHVGWATGQPGVTPMLDAMAARGTWFEAAVTAQPLTLPSHTSLLTGQYPYTHGVRNNGTYVVGDEVTTLAERLHDAGYATHAVVSAYVLDSQFGLDQGFDSYDDDLRGGPEQKMFMFKEVPADRTAVRAVRWLREVWSGESQPFFLWLHFFDPHADHTPPADVAALFPGDPYTAEIAFADRELGRVFKELDERGVLDDTLVVFTSDHGEGLGEHGEDTHGLFVYESTTRVPLLMAGPGVPAGGRVADVVRTVDVTPTVLELVGLDVPAGLDGASLAAIWRGDDTPRVAYTETFVPRQSFGWSELRALRGDRWKVIEAPRDEVYDLSADPREQRDLSSTPLDPQAAPLRAELDARTAADPYTSGAQAPGTMDAATRARLAALGYADAAPTGDGPLPDPKDQLPFWRRFQQGQDLLRRKQHADAEVHLRALVADDPRNVLALGSLANALTGVGKHADALAAYLRMTELEPEYVGGWAGLARMNRELKQWDAAEAAAREVIRREPENPDGHVALGDVFLDQGRYAEAEPAFREALRLDPTAPLGASGLGNCLNRAGDLPGAHAVLTAAYATNPDSHAILYNLGVVTERRGDVVGALELYQRALALDDEHSMTWNNLGSLLERLSRRHEAVKHIRRAHELDPDNVEATYNLGALLVLDGQAAEALPLLERALAQQPGIGKAEALRARALQLLGRSR